MTDDRPTFAGLFYDPDGNEIDLLQWAAIGCGAEPGFSRVADTTTKAGVRVSTVWFGINTGRSDPPMIYETMVSDSQGQVFHRWPDRAAAEAGHAELVAYHGGEPWPEPPSLAADPFNPQVGDIVCDCRFKHLRVAERDGDDLVLEDGQRCSLRHCCDDPDHTWEHPTGGPGEYRIAAMVTRPRGEPEGADADVCPGTPVALRPAVTEVEPERYGYGPAMVTGPAHPADPGEHVDPVNDDK